MRWYGFVCALMFVLLTACTAPPAPQPGAPAAPAERRATNQVLQLAAPSVPPSATQHSTPAQNYIFNAQFDSLVLLDSRFDLQPSIASRWELVPGENAWRFTLRRDLTFSNGDKLTAADVEFTFKLMLATPPPPQRSFVARLAGVRVIDDYTVDLLTDVRDVSSLFGTSYVHIFPKAYYEQAGKDAFATKPIGSGPFELAEFVPNDRIVYRTRSSAHPYRKPVATEIRWRAVPDSTTLVNGIRLGELDAVFGGITPDQADQLKRDGNGLAQVSPTSLTMLIDKAAIERVNSPLLDKRVRQALNYAIDRNTIIATLYRGLAIKENQIAIPETPAFDPAIPAIPFDPALAKRLLSEAGYPNGFKLSTPLEYQNTGLTPQVFVAVQDSWRQIGVEASLGIIDTVTWNDKVFARNNQVLPELIQHGGSDSNGFLSFYRGYLSCNLPPALVRWCVPEFDRLMNEAYGEPDTAKRTDLLRRAMRAHAEEWNHIFLVAAPTYVASGQKVRALNAQSLPFWQPDTLYKVE